MTAFSLFLNEPINDETIDYFGIKETHFFDYLKQMIISLDKSTILGLYGDYGSGKSSILNLLAQDLKKDNYEFIIFDAWKYEIGGDIASPLIAKLIGLAKGYGNAQIVKSGKRILKVLAVTGMDIFLKSTLDYSVKAVEDAFNLVEKGGWDDAIEKAGRDFEKIITTLSENGQKKVVIAIDNLDRCTPENVISLLCSIRTFFVRRNLNLIFIISTYDKVIKAYVEKLYSGVYRDGGTFLEKIIEYHVTVPIPSHPQFENLVQKVTDDTFFIQSAIIDLNDKYLKNSQKLRNLRKALQIVNKVIMYSEYKRLKGCDRQLKSEQLLGLSLCVGWNKFMNWILSSDENSIKRFYDDVIFTRCIDCGRDEEHKTPLSESIKQYIDIVDEDLIIFLRKAIANEKKLINLRSTLLVMRVEGII